MSVPYATNARHDVDVEIGIQESHSSAPYATEIMPKMTVEGSEGRPRLNRENLVIPGCVTRYEQDMIDLASTFTRTFTTEAGRLFVERNSRVADRDDFRDDDHSSCIIMWPTHPPRESESFDGEFGSDVNWIFARCQPMKHTEMGLTPTGRAIRVVITGSLYPLQDSSKHTKVLSSVLIEEPSRYLKPNGELLRAAMATFDAKCAEKRAVCHRCWQSHQDCVYCCSFILLCIFLFVASMIFLAYNP